jgi:CspA family cold shock protein
MNGTVKWFNKDKGFGFIAPEEGGKDVYVHRTNVIGDALRDGQRVEFEVSEGRKGPEATNVRGL